MDPQISSDPPPPARYCSIDHQKTDRPAHKFHCGLIKKALAKLAREEAALRARSSNDSDRELPPGDPFVSAVGHFWGYMSTRPYMRARNDVVIDLLNIRTGEAVEAALGHLRDMLRLCPSDNLGVRSQVPALYLRLGRDQEAYDFLRWYADKSVAFYNSHDPEIFLDVHGADPFEAIDCKNDGMTLDLSFKVALLLIKARLFVDVSMLEGFLQQLGDKAPQDKMEIVKEECMSDILLTRRDVVDAADYTPIMASLRQQMVATYQAIKEHNKYMIPALENPERYSHAQLEAFSIGSQEEAAMAWRFSWYSWAESPAVLQQILPLLKEA